MSNVQNLFSQPSFPSPYPGQSFFGSGSIQVFSSSGTFIVPPGVTRIRVRVWGAGGSGGIAVASARNKAASGGGGGGHCIKVIDTTPGTSYTVTVGAGGAAVSGTSVQAGNAGGTSSFGSVCSATGGGAGQAGASNAINLSVAGASGGTATGGDLNYSGGGSGACSITPYSGSFYRNAATGGGSAGSIFGNGYSSGSVTTTISPIAADVFCVTGGGGVGGASGNLTQPSNNYNEWFTGGGGTYGPSAALTTANTVNFTIGGAGWIAPRPVNEQNSTNNLTNAYVSLPAEYFNSFSTNGTQPTNGTNISSGANLIGSYPANCVNRFPGDVLIGQAWSPAASASAFTVLGSPGCGMSSCTGHAVQYKVAGALGGGCGSADPSNNNIKGGNASVGGGGGGLAGYVTNDAGSFSGQGGNGQVVVEW